MTRRSSPILPIFSGLCCVLLCGLWGASYWRWFDVTGPVAGELRYVIVNRGELAIFNDPISGGGSWSVNVVGAQESTWAAEFPSSHDGFGFGFVSTPAGAWGAWYPMWFAAMLTAVPPAWWWRRRRTRGARGFEIAPGSPE